MPLPFWCLLATNPILQTEINNIQAKLIPFISLAIFGGVWLKTSLGFLKQHFHVMWLINRIQDIGKQIRWVRNRLLRSWNVILSCCITNSSVNLKKKFIFSGHIEYDFSKPYFCHNFLEKLESWCFSKIFSGDMRF